MSASAIKKVPEPEIIFLKYEQPKESAWNEILSFSEQWNQTKKNKFISIEMFNQIIELNVFFPSEDHPELKELENILSQKNSERRWKWTRTTRAYHPTREETEDRDYVLIIGDGYSDDFFMNETIALSAMKNCKTCGTKDPDLTVQKKAPQIDEAFLDMENETNDRYVPKGLDIINLQHGALLVSKKFVKVIKDNKIQGCTFLDVFNQAGNVSDRLFQLAADPVILLSDDPQEEGAICATCGEMLRPTTTDLVVRRDRLSGSSFFSMSPARIYDIYVSKQVYQLLKAANIRGLTPMEGADLLSDEN